MAEALAFLEEDLTCVICCDVYIDPVTLKCSHSLCEKCLQEFWSTQDVIQCPVCRKECSPEEPTKSLAFKSLCESFKTRKPTAVPEDICQEHKEKLKLFCFEDKKPICVVCYTSKKHENHKCSPVEEAVVTVKVREVAYWLGFDGIGSDRPSILKSLSRNFRRILRNASKNYRWPLVNSRKPKTAPWNKTSSLRYVVSNVNRSKCILFTFLADGTGEQCWKGHRIQFHDHKWHNLKYFLAKRCFATI